MSEIHLREIKSSDLNQLYALDKKCFPPEISYSRKYIKQLLEMENKIGIVLTIKFKIIGFVLAVKYGEVSVIVTLDIDPKYRRKGYGNKLIKALEKQLKREKIKIIILQVNVNNKSAISFYKKNGYEITDEMENYYPNNENAYEMVKALES